MTPKEACRPRCAEGARGRWCQGRQSTLAKAAFPPQGSVFVPFQAVRSIRENRPRDRQSRPLTQTHRLRLMGQHLSKTVWNETASCLRIGEQRLRSLCWLLWKPVKAFSPLHFGLGFQALETLMRERQRDGHCVLHPLNETCLGSVISATGKSTKKIRHLQIHHMSPMN